MAFPAVGLIGADRSGTLIKIFGTDSQQQFEHAVTPRFGFQAVPVGVVPCRRDPDGERMSGPGIGTASTDGVTECCKIDRMQFQLQRIYAVTAVTVLQAVGIAAGGMQGPSAPAEAVGAAYTDRIRMEKSIIHRKIQIIDAVATVHSLVFFRIGACFRVTAPLPAVAAAGANHHGVPEGIDRIVENPQLIDAVTMVHRRI